MRSRTCGPAQDRPADRALGLQDDAPDRARPQFRPSLLGGLIGYRRIIFGDRDWRAVWRVAQDKAGDFRVEVAEVWAVGYRKYSEVYAEINQRVADADSSPKTKALTEVLELFAKQARDLTATPEPETPEPVPAWLTKALLHVVGLQATTVKEMNLEQADKVWNDYTSGAGSET